MSNPSGISPCEFNVVVRPDPVEQKTAGGLIRPDEVMEREKHSGTRGTLVALSPMAFNGDVWPQDADRPSPGQRVMLARHSGIFAKGDDGVEYRIVKDKDIVAMIEGK